MRLRKRAWVDTLIQSPPPFVLPDLKQLAGKTRDQFSQVRLEIGSGKGDYWIQMSANHPDILWIGIEKDVKVGAIAVKKAMETVQPNQLFIIGDALVHLSELQDGDIDVIHLNFSDPWPKKRNHKRRLSAHTFLQQYQRVLKEHGHIIMKTDNKELFEFSMGSITQSGFVVEEMSVDFRRVPHEDAFTEYERHFVSLNQPIYRCVWRKI